MFVGVAVVVSLAKSLIPVNIVFPFLCLVDIVSFIVAGWELLFNPFFLIIIDSVAHTRFIILTRYGEGRTLGKDSTTFL
jgi:hypothetical protein